MRSQDTFWSHWLTNVVRLSLIWVALVVILQIFRTHLLWKYANALNANTQAVDVLAALWMGFRFDSAISAVMLLLPFAVISGYSVILGLCLKEPHSKEQFFVQRSQIMVVDFVKWFVIFVGVLTITLCAANIPFFQEYHESYNQFVFEALYDDPMAILQTAIQQSHPLVYLVIVIFTSMGFIRWVKAVYQYQPNWLVNRVNRHRLSMTVITLIVLLATLVACRGGVDQRPVMRKWASISKDQMLNRLIINPIRSLHYAYEDYKNIQAPEGGTPFSKEIAIPTLEQLERAARGSNEQPEHIVLVVMESYDAWPLMDKYRSLHLSSRVSAIANKGVHFKHFLPASKSTMNSLVSIISGVAYTGANHSRQMTYQTPNPLSLFEAFNRLGYETFFFYGGFLSWQNVGKFVTSQGAQYVYSAPDAGGKTASGVWGIDDDQLFTMALEKLPRDKKTFSVILTTSYHGPYTVDIYKKGFPYRRWSDLPNDIDTEIDPDSMKLIEMGHLWYADKAIGDFVDQFEKTFKKPLVSLTGDHFGRRFLHQRPTLEEQHLVPFILYPADWVDNKSIEAYPGSHLDIAPTLIDIAANKGFSYHSLGRSMFDKTDSSTAFGYAIAIEGNELIPMALHSQSQENNEKYKRLEKNYKDTQALHWVLTYKQQFKKHDSTASLLLGNDSQ